MHSSVAITFSPKGLGFFGLRLDDRRSRLKQPKQLKQLEQLEHLEQLEQPNSRCTLGCIQNGFGEAGRVVNDARLIETPTHRSALSVLAWQKALQEWETEVFWPAFIEMDRRHQGSSQRSWIVRCKEREHSGKTDQDEETAAVGTSFTHTASARRWNFCGESRTAMVTPRGLTCVWTGV